MGCLLFRRRRECFILSLDERGTVRYGLHYKRDVNHYRRTHCYSTVASVDDGQSAPSVTPDPSKTRAAPGRHVTLLFTHVVWRRASSYVQAGDIKQLQA